MDLTTLALAKSYTDKQIERAEMGDIELDSSLTKAGFAADAAAVGEAIKNVDLSGYATEEYVNEAVAAFDPTEAVNTALAAAKESGEFDGQPGKDGGYYTPSVTQPNANTMRMDFAPNKADMPPVASVDITLPAGPAGADGKPGKDGSDGQPGKDGAAGQDGNGIKSTVLNADYTLTITFDDGTKYTTPSIRGEPGAQGKQGEQGPAGTNGNDYVLSDADKAEIAEQAAALVDLNGSAKPPAYWDTAIANATAKVKALQVEGGKECVSFIWASDTHISDNDSSRTNDLGKIWAKILENCNIPFAVISGDIGSRSSIPIGSGATDSDMIAFYEKNISQHLFPLFNTERLLMAVGNHDGCYGLDTVDGTTVYYRRQFSPEQMWQTFFRGQALDFRRVFSDDGQYFFVDNIAQKTRFIILNSQFGGVFAEDDNGFAVNNRFTTYCYGQEQLDWLSDIALDMPSGYSAVIVAHIAPNNTAVVDRAQLVGIINAFNNKATFSNAYSGVAGWTSSTIDVDFSAAEGKVIAVFAGHVHQDTVDTETLNCPIVTITAAGAPENPSAVYTRTINTDTETAFDVVTINKATGTIYCTRLGVGSDRQITEEISTYTITVTAANCTAGQNNPTTVDSNGTATLTFAANSGYELPSSVTVSGASCTWDKANGMLVLSNPTGNIVVTVIATASSQSGETSFTNLADPLPDNTTDTTKWVNGYRFTSSGIGAQAGTTLTNEIPCTTGDVIRFKGAKLRENADRVMLKTTQDSQYGYFNNGIPGNVTFNGVADGVYTFTIIYGADTYVRFAMPTPADASAIVITVNEEIDSTSSYTNLIPEIGFEDNMRLGSANGGQTKAQSGIVTIGYIDRADYDAGGATETIIRIRGIDPTAQPSYSGVCFYTSGTLAYNSYYALSDILSGTKGGVTGAYDSTTGVLTLTCSKTSMSNGSVFRICAQGVGANLVVTANEEITD